MPEYRHKHPLNEDLYTPATRQLVDLFEEMARVHGTYRKVCALTGTRTKVFRLMRQGGKYKSISMTKLDIMIQKTGVGDLRDFPWYTADQMVEMGAWKPTRYVAGRKRYRLKYEREED
jgi:hypothetical protein